MSSKNWPTRILACSCHNEYQDEKYGRYKRVFNRVNKIEGNNPLYRCTICGNERRKVTGLAGWSINIK